MNHPSPTHAARRVANSGAAVWAQRALAVAAVLAVIFLLVSIAQQIAATQPFATPARVVHIATGPYPLTVSFSHYPAAAGYALPFAIAPARPISGVLSYGVTAIPDPDVDATPVNASLTRDTRVANRVTGTVEITVRGEWTLSIAVNGPSGPDVETAPISAEASGVIPTWIAWLIGFIPALGIALYFLLRWRSDRLPQPNG